MDVEGLFALCVGDWSGRARPDRIRARVHHGEQPEHHPAGAADLPVVVASGFTDLCAKAGSFNAAMLVHGEQSVTLHDCIAVEGTVNCVSSITGIYDKGSGAVIAFETAALDAVSGSEYGRPPGPRSSAVRSDSAATAGLRGGWPSRSDSRTTP